MTTAVVKKMLPPKTTVWWVPISAAGTRADVLKATLYADEGPAKNLSCGIVSGMTLAATDSETDDTTTICDSAAANTPVRSNFEANIPFLREDIDQGTGKANDKSPAEVAFQLFKNAGPETDVSGWLVQRLGYAQDTAAKAGQLVSVFKVRADNPQDVIGEGTTPIQFTVPFMPQGDMATNVPLT